MRWLGVLALCASSACATTRAPLPPGPPLKSPGELWAWKDAPQLAPESELRLDWKAQRETLPSGLGVTVIARPETRVTAMELWLPSARDPSNGAVAVLGEALRAGTHTAKGALLVNPKLAQRPVYVRTEGIGTTFAWQVLPRASELAIDLLADFVAHPAFDPEETQIRMQQELSAIQRYSGSSQHLADLARELIPSVDIPTPEQDALGLVKLDRRRLSDLHRCAVSPVGAELVVAGPVDIERVTAWARSSFADFKPAPGCEPSPHLAVTSAAASNPESTRLDRLALHIVYGGISDPLMVMVIPGPAPSSEDYLPFALLARVIEGRDEGIARELRHAGATYGIHARLNESLPELTLLELQGQLEPDSAQAALRALVTDIRGLSETLTDGELDEVKRRWRNAYVNSLSDNVAVAGAAMWQLRRGRAPEAVKSWPNELNAISPERCREVAKRWLAESQPSIAVAGVPVRLVRGLGLGVEIKESYWTDKLQEHKKGLR